MSDNTKLATRNTDINAKAQRCKEKQKPRGGEQAGRRRGENPQLATRNS